MNLEVFSVIFVFLCVTRDYVFLCLRKKKMRVQKKQNLVRQCRVKCWSPIKIMLKYSDNFLLNFTGSSFENTSPFYTILQTNITNHCSFTFSFIYIHYIRIVYIKVYWLRWRLTNDISFYHVIWCWFDNNVAARQFFFLYFFPYPHIIIISCVIRSNIHKE